MMKMIHELWTRVYWSWILYNDENEICASILDSDLWETIVEAIAKAIKQIADEEWVSVENIIEDILSDNDNDNETINQDAWCQA